MKNETPRSDAAEEQARLNYEMSRECGDPPYPGADMADFARKLEHELNEVLTTFRHRHVNNGKNDACNKCGFDLRHEIHERVVESSNDPSSATRHTGRYDCNRDAHAGFAAAAG